MITNPVSVAFIALFVLWVISMIFIGVTLDRTNKCYRRMDILNARCDAINDMSRSRFYRCMSHMKERNLDLERLMTGRIEKICHDYVMKFHDEEEEHGYIYIISQEQFFLDRSVNNTSTLYYSENIDQLKIVYENGESVPITNPEDVVGDALKHFGEMSTDPNKVYVRNKRYDVDFEVVRMTRNV